VQGTEPPSEPPSEPRSLPSLEQTIGPGERGERPFAIGPGDQIGRYLVIRQVGMGGMGAVYAAYDPELDRKIALKLVRFDPDRDGEASRARLLREAQAMARVTHTNVVTVHDVGIHHEQVYVAMEFIEGVTVKAWSKQPRSWQEIVDVFRQAGAGLAAAHEQGLVHRDFKPENTMIVARSGRVVVLDFGLARGEVTKPSDASPERPSQVPSHGPSRVSSLETSASRSTLLSTELTRAGDLMGTPAYMSLEQFARGHVDAASDQFGFCVSFYESLYGHRPFRGDSPAALMFAISKGQIAPGDAGRSVPAWLRRVVVRGLAPDPTQRWPSMSALLDALAPERRRRRRNALAIAGLLVVAAGAVGLVGGRGSEQAACSGADRHLDGVWDDERRQRTSDHVRTLALPWFDHTWISTTTRLDEYAAEWIAVHQDACEATTRHREQSERVMDMRMSCLAHAKVELGAVTDRLLALDPAEALRVPELLDGLPELARCSDLAALELDVEPPAPAIQAEVAEVREAIAHAGAALRLGKTDAADSLGALNDRVLGIDYPPLHTEYLLELGRAQRFAGRPGEARTSLDEALRLALAHQQHALVIDALHLLTVIAGVDLQQPPQAMIYATVSQGIAGKVGLEAESIRLGERTLATALGASGQYEPALATYRAVLDVTPPERELERANTLAGIAMLLETQARFGEAEQAYREVIEVHTAVLGDAHPDLASDYSNLGNALMMQHRYDEAESAQRRALELDLTFFAADHPAIAGSRANLGATLAAAGQHEAAEAEFRSVLEIIGEAHPRAPLVHANLGTLALDQGHDVDAEREYRLALELYAQTLGVDHPATIVVHSTLGAALDGQARHVEAEVEHRKALALALEAHGEDHDLVAKARQRLGSNLIDQARPIEAVALLESSLAHRIEQDAETSTIATTRFALARALWDARQDRTRAQALARTALSEFGESRHANEVRAWLAAHADP
jgi:tetratricopeptide (TPR) repeat protein